ncbi:ap-5 complex subunit zeta-1 [Anaeramoeba flamelloides]|uniref:Ap-5 complex subunit zeta-1 n=1 Tax=Anaeramoeba flamelloides TaxID=1746091 RepID=A0ABQ8XT78_9EUKA|nr:ap-5 complex subunit zeta-1 [Anaeramoeba flamelloides]
MSKNPSFPFPEEKTQKIFSKFQLVVENKSQGNELVDSLRSLLLSYQFSKKKPRLNKEQKTFLINIIKNPNSTSIMKSLSSHILRTTSGYSKGNVLQITLKKSNGEDLESLICFLDLWVDGKRLEKKIPQILSWISRDQLLTEQVIPFLSPILSDHPFIFQKKTRDAFEKQFIACLTRASLNSAVITGSFWRQASPIPVTEFDGSKCLDFFTVLNCSQSYTNDQMTNVYTFSLLYSWLKTLYLDPIEKQKQKEKEKEEEEEGFGNNEEFQKEKGNKKIIKLNERFCEDIIKYCLRTLDQAVTKISTEQSPKEAEVIDSNIQEIVEMESIRILTLICQIDPGQIQKVTSITKKIYERRKTQKHSLHPFVEIMNFVIMNIEQIKYDFQPMIESIFGEKLFDLYYNSLECFDLLEFVLINRELLLENYPSIFSKHFLAFFRILAWNPDEFSLEFLELLPTLIHPENYLEIFHTLLDLPILSLCLELSLYKDLEKNVDLASFSEILNYILRKESSSSSGKGKNNINFWDQNEYLSVLQDFLESNKHSPRVISCCKIVPILLQIYFDVLISYASIKEIQELSIIMFNRYFQLFSKQSFLNQVQKLILEKTMSFFAGNPSLIFDLNEQFISTLQSLSPGIDYIGKIDFLISITWIIGEYANKKIESRLSNEIISTFFGAIEVIAFEYLTIVEKSKKSKKGSTNYSMGLNESQFHKQKQSQSQTQSQSQSQTKFQIENENKINFENQFLMKKFGNKFETQSLLKQISTEQGKNQTRLLITLILALTKIASRNHSFIQRTLVIISKIMQHSEKYNFLILEKAEEAIKLLNNPGIASLLFDMEKSARSQKNSYNISDEKSSLPFLLLENDSQNESFHNFFF